MEAQCALESGAQRQGKGRNERRLGQPALSCFYICFHLRDYMRWSYERNLLNEICDREARVLLWRGAKNPVQQDFGQRCGRSVFGGEV